MHYGSRGFDIRSAVSEAQAAAYAAEKAGYACKIHGDIGADKIGVDSYGSPTCLICHENRVHEKRVEFVKEHSGIPKRFHDACFESFIHHSDKARENCNAARTFAEKFDEHKEKGRSLVFFGGTGTGKTHLACAICRSIIMQKGKRCRYTKAYHIVRDIKASFKKSDIDEVEIINGFLRPDLLVVDEVGVQYGSDTEKLLLFEVINGRYESVKPTIVVSNLTRDEIGNYLGDRVMDRLKENGGAALAFDWKSHRA